MDIKEKQIKFLKGSQEAKSHMERIRSFRKSKTPTPTPSPSPDPPVGKCEDKLKRIKKHLNNIVTF